MAEPQRTIKKLAQDVVNRIAAGEIIHRPANALKELIENSLDAGASSISIQIKSGGIKLLQIVDNGHGIKRNDLDIVCERFTTSKLQTFEDLETICTFGFRGEALASISHVAHLTITSKTKEQQCAFKAKYIDGNLAPFTPGAPVKPRPCAGVVGTQITVEDLFYNVTTRKRALKNTAEEYNKILEVVTRYALHNPSVSFSCKKQSATTADIQTPGGTTVEAIRVLFGNALARELIEINCSSEEYNFSATGFITNPNYSAKKGTFIFFINNRLIESPNIKKALNETYSTYLPKHEHPFVYLAIKIKPQFVDVNVHPTKSEVHVLNEKEIIEIIQKSVEEKLVSCNCSRNYQVQTTLTKDLSLDLSSTPAPTNVKSEPNKLVRTDPKSRPITAFFGSSNNQAEQQPVMMDDGEDDISYDVIEPGPAPAPAHFSQPKRVESKKRQRTNSAEGDELISASPKRKQPKTKEYKPILLTSIRNLITEFEKIAHQGLSELFHNYTFVGCVNGNFALVQYRTKLYLIQLSQITYELFYQVGLRRFNNFSTIRLSTPLSIHRLIVIALDSESSGWTEEDGDKEQIAEYNTKMLVSYADMLQEYFSISIKDGNLQSLPQMISKYIPPLENLPMFILNICVNVDWSEEQSCLGGIVKELALFYQLEVLSDDEVAESDMDPTNHSSRAWITENIILPALRTDFTPPKKLGNDGTIVQIASLEKLYKVFERC